MVWSSVEGEFPKQAQVGAASRKPGGFLLGREPPLWRQMIDHAREMLTQSGKQLIALHTCLLHEISDPVLAESGL
jgi:hypothetical protein